jgi:hypothetical protein
MANGGTLNGKEIDFKVEGRDVKATLNDQNLVEKVSYLNANEVIGDFPDEITYSDYADFGGVKFPKHIVETQDGFPVLDIMISDVKPNASVAIDVPPAVGAGGCPAGSPGSKDGQTRRRRLVRLRLGRGQLGGRV